MRSSAAVMSAMRLTAADEAATACVAASRAPPAGAAIGASHAAPSIGARPLGARTISDWGAATALRLPLESGKVSKWLKSEGERFEAGEAIAELQNDVLVLDYEAPQSGFLAKILLPEMTELANEDEVIALIVDSEGDIAGVQDRDWSSVVPGVAKGHEGAAAAPAAAQAVFGDRRLSPAAAHLARSHGLDVSGVTGTGRHGVVTKGDVLVLMGRAPASSLDKAASAEPDRTFPPKRAAAAAPAAAASPAASAPAPAAAAPAAAAPLAEAVPLSGVIDLGGNLPAAVVEPAERPASVGGGSFSDVKPSTMRRVIASRLTESKGGVPHSYSVMDCRIDALLDLRKQLKAVGVNVSVNDLVIKAVARALAAVPEVNCRYDAKADAIVANDSVDISVAVATDGGLITPIVAGADTLGLSAINAAVKDLAARARKGKLAPEEYQGGSFAVSNLGMFGIDEFSAVINPPQAAILAVGRGARRAVFKDDSAAVAADVDSLEEGGSAGGEPEMATVMSVMMSADRRVVDEAVAGQFLAVFRQHCEQPALLMA